MKRLLKTAAAALILMAVFSACANADAALPARAMVSNPNPADRLNLRAGRGFQLAGAVLQRHTGQYPFLRRRAVALCERGRRRAPERVYGQPVSCL